MDNILNFPLSLETHIYNLLLHNQITETSNQSFTVTPEARKGSSNIVSNHVFLIAHDNLELYIAHEYSYLAHFLFVM